MADDITHYDAVEAYAGRLSYRPGDDVTLHVSCTSASYDVEIHRWGAQRTPVWSAAGLPGLRQSTPPDADSNGCGWEATVTVNIPESWRSGFYHVTLRALRRWRRC